MNILQILPALEVGGVERGTIDLARYLTLNGHKSVVVSGGGRLVRRLDEVGARHYCLAVGRKSPFSILFMIGRLSEIIKKENIDIVHARSRVPAIIGFFASKITGRIFITTAHGYYNTHLTSRPMGWGRFVIVASSDMARHMRDDFSVPYDRIRLIPRGVNLDEFKFTERPAGGNAPGRAGFTVGMISRITPLKGHKDFLRAASIVARSVPGLKILIVGDVPPSKEKYREELELIARRLGLSNIVKFMGSREDIPDILSRLDVLVLPTKTPEAFGRVIVEAQAAGVPVVASRVGGIVDIIKDGENGLLTFPEDPRSIANAILRLAKDRGLARLMAERARKTAENKYSLQAMAKATINVYREALALKKILIIKISALGDVILSVPSLRAVRKKFPGARIKALVGLASADILRGCPYIDERIVYDPDARDAGLKGLLKTASRLRKEDFDIVIDLQNNKASHLLSFLSMAAARYGYDNKKWGFLLNRRVRPVKKAMDPVTHQFRTLKLLGIEKGDEALELWLPKENEKWADDFLMENWTDAGRVLAGVNIGASGRWRSKRWDTAYIARLCDELAKKYNIRTVLTGVGEDREAAAQIAALTKSKPIIAAGKTDILKLAALIKRCGVYITTDSAPLHIAACLKRPLIALFGPTDPKRHMPHAAVCKILKANVRCAPCYNPVCPRDHRCMKRIKVEDVLSAVDELISGAL